MKQIERIIPPVEWSSAALRTRVSFTKWYENGMDELTLSLKKDLGLSIKRSVTSLRC
jgi:hypothetical protein